MAFCQNCGAQFSEGAKFCPSCGTPVQAVEAPAPAWRIRRTERTGLEDQADGEEIIPLEELSLEMLQEEIIQNGGSAGIAIIGYVDSQSTEAFLREYVAYSYVGGKRFFLQDADIVMTEGQELYAVVPATPEGTVTVYASSISEMGEYVDDSTPLYTGDPGEAVIVLCNISEIYSNVLVSVSDGFGGGAGGI